MFWLAVVSGGLILLQGLLLLILRFRKKNSEKQGGYGALIFPRFEIFLLILALPCICEASAALIQGNWNKYFLHFPYALGQEANWFIHTHIYTHARARAHPHIHTDTHISVCVSLLVTQMRPLSAIHFSYPL